MNLNSVNMVSNMIKIELELNENVYELARTNALFQHISVERLFADILEKQVHFMDSKHSSIGLFADEPDMMDRVMEMVRSERDKPILAQEREVA